MQSWITRMIEGGDLTDIFHSNDWTRVTALATTYATVPALLAELQRSEATTATMVATLPPAVAARKHLLYHLAEWLPTLPEHVREHLVELREQLAAARARGGGAA